MLTVSVQAKLASDVFITFVEEVMPLYLVSRQDNSQETPLMLRNLRDAISCGGRKRIGKWLAAVYYAEGVLTYRQAAVSYSVYRPTGGSPSR